MLIVVTASGFLLELRLLLLELVLRLGDFRVQILPRLGRHNGTLGRVLFFRYPFRFDPRQLDGQIEPNLVGLLRRCLFLSRR
jgi:hypothetical protein